MRTWPARGVAEQLRQWPTLVHIAALVEASPLFEGLLLIGSFAAGRADDVSDIDLVGVVAEGSFSEAWATRRELEPPGTIHSWTRPWEDEARTHKFFTREFVHVELVLATPTSGFEVADPVVPLVGEESLVKRFKRREAIPREELEDFVEAARAAGEIPPVQEHYGELIRAIRAARQDEEGHR
jgi:hypothetical protein